MAASLVVAAMLVSGLGELTRQFARTTVRVRATVEDTRAPRLVQSVFEELERSEEGDVNVTASTIDAVVGSRRVRFRLSHTVSAEELEWETGPSNYDAAGSPRVAEVSVGARFELGEDGVVRLWDADSDPPLALVAPRRDAPFDCHFDVVVRDCR